jgi:spermidine synthase
MTTNDVALQPGLGAARPATAAGSGAIVGLFTFAIFLSAFLLFLVQPMIAKMVLPVLGGAPAVWNACVVFFQIALLAGYGYAHGLCRESSIRRQLTIHLALLAVPLTILPFTIDGASLSPPAGNPVFWLLALLSITIGLPFFALSTTASVLQHWFSRTGHRRAEDPYFLYAASNLGSLLALAAYPTIVEPSLTLGQQGRWWSVGYGAFVLLAAGCGWTAWHQSPSDALPHRSRAAEGQTETITARRRLRWTLLAFVPSSLMLAVTSYASTDIAAVPLFWIVPLAVYLLTFVVAFSGRAAAGQAIARRAVPLLVIPLVMTLNSVAVGAAAMLFALHLSAFAAVALLCHGQLAADRPQAAGLTEFYFWMSFGGMLGGLFNALAAPVLFDRIVEYPLVLALACFCLPAARPLLGTALNRLRLIAVPLGAIAVLGMVIIWARTAGLNGYVLTALFGLAAVIAFSQKPHPLRFGPSVAALLLAGAIITGHSRMLHAERTFFGVYRVTVNEDDGYRALVHGTTLHGMQALDPAASHEPLFYYHRTGPVGQMFEAVPAAVSGRRVGVIGLGVGAIAGYARPGQQWDFFEIDPAVERIARTPAYFTFLERCAAACKVIIGDARLSLARAPAAAYDLIVLDAFSSDAIPVHLLTREAIGVYLSRLAPGGALAFHISNNHLTLSPVVAAIARSHNLVAFEQYDRSGLDIQNKSASRWVLAAQSRDALGAVATDPRWVSLEPQPGFSVWTDDFSNILAALKGR